MVVLPIPVRDWPAWAVLVKQAIEDLRKDVAALQGQPSQELRQLLIEILTNVAVTDQKVNATLNRQEWLRLQIEALAKSIMDETKLTEMQASLAESGKALDDAMKKDQGPE